jgi:Bacterial archaeo-eukaryotic release factor family 3
MLVMQKIRAIARGLNFDTRKKSIAIFVSPVFEKVLYLDIAVEEKVIVDESFEIRDLIYSKKQLHKYLVLMLSAKESRIYLGDSICFTRIISDTPESVFAYDNDLPERVANFTDISGRKEIMMDKFLHHIDHSIGIILNAYHLPLFVMGAERVLGHFRKISRHANTVVEYVQGNYEEDSMEQLKEVLAPYIAGWKRLMQNDLLNRLAEAAGQKKLVVGIKDVWRESMMQKGRLLVVEKDYMYAAQSGGGGDIIDTTTEPHHTFSYIKDAVDDVIEKVLENGGDVEFTDHGVLDAYQHIALVKYY